MKDDWKKKKVVSCRVQSDKSEEADKSKTGKDKGSCVLCNGNHNLDECKVYNDMVVKEHSKFLTQQKLCYGCYEEISSTHTARNCPK